MNENSYLQWLFNPFPMKIDVTHERQGVAFQELAVTFWAIIEQIKKRIYKKKSDKILALN